ncbi:MAG: alpha-mannosidase [Oscillospiraceae bacterium]|nr:alpha-mannosidase [Oscillospiraceae bacterium]
MHIKEKLQTFCQTLLEHSVQTISPIDGIEMVACDYKQSNTPPENGWQPCRFLSGADKHFWLRFSLNTPQPREGAEYLLQCRTGPKGWNPENSQGLLYLNGEMVQGLDLNHIEAFLEPETQYSAYVYLYTGGEKYPFPFEARLMCRYTDVDGLYYDIVTPLEALECLNENSCEYREILTALEQAVNLVDTRQVYSEAYFASVRAAREFLEEEFYAKKCTTQGKPVVHCVGHTHIDVEWLWARRQTREKIQRSFATANALMEKYPEYLFTLSQPQLYQYLKEEAPEKYAQLKSWVAQGRWEPEGSMWVECDCNLVSGESFVRQLLLGKKFFREEFGAETRTLYLPDVFGYSAALPQILKKSGIEYFVTSKISWNDTNTLPVDAFLWEGIDGTELFTTFITSQRGHKNHEYSCYVTYNGRLNASFAIGTWDRFQQKQYCSRALMTYGFGDGGGGPVREDLEKQRRLCRGIPGVPVTQISFLNTYLDKTKSEFDENCRVLGRIPKWTGDLYLEFHRGTYTSMAKNKRSNRKSEFALQRCEALSFTDLLLGGSYDQPGLNDTWHTVLHNQFHDILPGSSILEVYQGTDADYAQVAEYCSALEQEKLSAIAERLNTQGGCLVYNPLGFARGGCITVDGKTLELTESVPAYGWKVIQPAEAACGVSVSGRIAENRHYRMELDSAGRIVSLLDKAADREVFAQPGNAFTAYEDLPYQFDNWELSDYYRAKSYALDADALIIPVYDGSRAGFRVEKQYMDCAIIQHIWLYTDDRRIDFDNQIRWNRQHQVLKVAFPLDLHATEATYEIQYGHIRRSTHQNTSWDAARFEVCAHKWADISENGYGVALLNDCKYGHSAQGSTLELTVLKAGTYPNPEADLGEHTFSYSLLPHTGSLYQADVIGQAYSFNQPLLCKPVEDSSGDLAETFSLASCDRKNIIIDTVKKAEADDGMILRLYDSFDMRCTANVTVADGFTKAFLCDMMESPLEQLPFDGHTVTVPVKNFEIITLKFVR